MAQRTDYHDHPFYSLFFVNEYAPDGLTTLHRACMDDDHPRILFLLAHGANPRLPVLYGNDQGHNAYDLNPYLCTPNVLVLISDPNKPPVS